MHSEFSSNLIFCTLWREEINLEVRCVKAEDVSEYYVRSLNESIYVENPPTTVAEQIDIIRRLNSCPNTIPLGFFDGGTLTATSFVRLTSGDAEIGIFIIPGKIKGKKLSYILILKIIELFDFKIKFFKAGVNKKNLPSLRAFLKAGFSQVAAPNEERIFLSRKSSRA